ncbi:MAG: NINE protein [Syntrophaceae bacterium]|nr:NINE protein [Syntrophaceae bacterium]
MNNTHLKSIGYVLWIFGFTGSHRFYYGRPVSGTGYERQHVDTPPTGRGIYVLGRESSQLPCLSSGGNMRLTIIMTGCFRLIWNF